MLFTFGSGQHGELGHGDTQSCGSPKQVETLEGKAVTWVACGWKHTICSTSTYIKRLVVTHGNLADAVFAWGNNAFGQLGIPPLESISTPQQPGSPPAVRSRSIGTESSSSASRGNRKRKIVPRAERQNSGDVLHPQRVEGLQGKRVRILGCGWTFTVAASGRSFNHPHNSQHSAVADEGIYTFGRNNYGQLGRGEIGVTHSHEPCLIKHHALTEGRVLSIACGSEHIVALDGCNPIPICH